MSALAGIAFADTQRLAERECARMLAAQKIYGPDGTAQTSAGIAALGRALACCLPEDEFDQQPISIAGGRFTLIADCRIDNRAAIALDCGLNTTGLSDTAVIAAAFNRWGRDCFDRLRGDFAVAVWDNQERCFILARDALGTMPLFFHHSKDMIAIASMPQGLNVLPQLPAKPDPDYVAATLRSFSVDGLGSFWQGIGRVTPGHIATLDFGGVQQRRYWLMPQGHLRLKDKRDYAAALREKIEHAVSSRLRGETQVATHLSAGLDSSAVTGAVATQLRGTGRVFAFTSAPREGYDLHRRNLIVDESVAAAETAALHANIDHIIVRPGADWSIAAVERQFQLAQEPAANICNLAWTHGIADAVKARGLKILIPGQMGNFAMSYDGMHMLSEPLSRRDWREAFGNLMTSGPGKSRLLSSWLNIFGPSWYVKLRQPDFGRHAGLSPGRDADATRFIMPRIKASYRDTIHEALLRVDLGPNRKALYAGWGIDERDPTMDRDLFDFTATLPLSVFRHNRTSRALIRGAAQKWVAPSVLAETKRGYQAADWHEGMTSKREWIGQEVAAMADYAPIAELLDIERIEQLVSEWPEGDWHNAATTRDYRLMLLRGISISHFMRRAAGSNR
jgi:asparagine synthase (glutamine-hydrolysing)